MNLAHTRLGQFQSRSFAPKTLCGTDASCGRPGELPGMIGVQARTTPTQTDWRYLGREALLIVLFAWALPIAGGMDGLISFRGQAGSAILFTLVAGIWLGQRLWARRTLPATGLELPLVLLVVVQGVSAAFSDVPRLSLPAIAQTLAYIVLFYLALDLARSGWPAELVEKCLLIGGAIVLALAALDLGTAFQGWLALRDLPFAPPFEHRLYAVVGDANILAGFTNILWPLALARLLTTRSAFARVMLGAVVALALTIQAFCYSRGATLALAAGGLVFALAWIGLVSTTLRRQAGRVWRWLVGNPIWLVAICLVGAGLGAALGWRLLVSRNSATQAPAAEARSTFWGVAWDALQTHPWLGVGPGAFPQAMSTAVSTPPEHLFMNAHSLIFNTLAETGGLGLAVGGLALGALAWALWRARTVETVGERARWAATAAAWAAFLTHGLVDYHVRYLALSVPLLVSAAFVIGAGPTLAAPRKPRTWSVAWLIPAAVIVVAFSAYQLTAAFRLEQATLAGRAGDWAFAAEKADQAAALDGSFGLYAAQAGFAYAQLADAAATDAATDQARDAAIARYVAALEAGPQLAVWEVDLAVLIQADGDRTAALRHLDNAQALAPNWGLPAMLRALWLERDDEITARSAFADALTREPALAASALWSATSLRRGVLAQWQANTPAGPDGLDVQIQALLNAGKLPDAQQLIERAWTMSPTSPWVYRAFSSLAAAQGSPTLAERYLQASEWLQTVAVRDQVTAALLRADQAGQGGEPDTARALYTFAWEAGSQVSPYGWGFLGYIPEAHFVFQRDAWPGELVPQTPQVDFDAGLAVSLRSVLADRPTLAPMSAAELDAVSTGSVHP